MLHSTHLFHNDFIIKVIIKSHNLVVIRTSDCNVILNFCDEVVELLSNCSISVIFFLFLH